MRHGRGSPRLRGSLVGGIIALPVIGVTFKGPLASPSYLVIEYVKSAALLDLRSGR